MLAAKNAGPGPSSTSGNPRAVFRHLLCKRRYLSLKAAQQVKEPFSIVWLQSSIERLLMDRVAQRFGNVTVYVYVYVYVDGNAPTTLRQALQSPRQSGKDWLCWT